jgi:hypothetical protein
MPSDDILSPKAANNFCVFEIFLGFVSLKAISQQCLFMQVTIVPVSNNHEKVLLPPFTVTLGLILSPLKGIIICNDLLQVALETVHKLKMSCGMLLGA